MVGMLMSENTDPAGIIDGLEGLIKAWFGGVSSFWARGEDWREVQNFYLQAVETADAQLAAMFDDDDGVAAGLFSSEYRLIREMTDATPRKAPLIDNEVRRQVHALESLREKARGALALRARPGSPVILDTNVLMHYHRPDEVSWREVTGEQPVRIILPMLVIDELDNKKYTGSDTMARRAAQAIRVLRRHSNGLQPDGAIVFGDGTTLEFLADDPGHSRTPNPDEELLNRAAFAQQAIGKPVTIVTGDLGMQLRASVRGLRHAVMPGKYAKDAQRRGDTGQAE